MVHDVCPGWFRETKVQAIIKKSDWNHNQTRRIGGSMNRYRGLTEAVEQGRLRVVIDSIPLIIKPHMIRLSFKFSYGDDSPHIHHHSSDVIVLAFN